MIGTRILRSVLPRPRTRVRVRHALPLIAFLFCFAAVCIGLEWSNTLLFARPGAFALMVVCLWIWWMHIAGCSGLNRFRALTALTVRLVLIGLFVMLLAQPRAVRTSDALSVVYALDISDSIGDESIDKALEFVSNTVAKKPEKDESGLIVFGRNAAVELPPRISFPFEAINSQIERDATNLEQSLSLAAAMLPAESQGRIVLISDGTETEGNLSQILDELKSRQIAVDVLPVQYNYEHEVWVERLELPRFVKLGENYEAAIILSSLQAGTGKLKLLENGQPIYEGTVKFDAGKNRYVIPIDIGEPGYYEYSARIEVPQDKDHLLKNNTVLNYIFVEGQGKVLVVTDPQGDKRDWELLVKAIREGERAVEVQTAYDFSRDSLSLMPYDCVVLVNVAADAFDVGQLQAIRNGVRDLGIGLMMVGGPNSFGPGGYHRTVIEEALPVTMDITKKKVLPKGALAIILHTCEFPEGNTWAKRITKQAIKVLGAHDDVGALAYGMGGEEWIFKLTPASEFEKLVPKINGAVIGDMPSFQGTMQMGFDALMKNDAAAKHMIIISDGDPSPPTPKLVRDFKNNQISVSMVAVFPHGGLDISKMKHIAGITGGRYYKPSDPSMLPAIFIKESKTLRRSMIQNKKIQPEIGFDSPIIKGIDSVPSLHGYVLTTAKSRALTILQVSAADKLDADDDEIEPVLVTWRYGLGTTAAFTSDLSPNWGKDWIEWDQYRAFVKQLITNISRVRKQGHLKLWSYTSGNEGVILVEDFYPQESFLEVQAGISGPGNRSETIALKQVGPRRYQATVDLWGKGRYQVMVEGAAGERKDYAQGGFIVPYSPEYLRFRSNPIILKEIARRTGGRDLTLEADDDAKAEVIYSRRVPKKSSRPIFDWFLIALVCLVPLDVAIRRIQLDWALIKSWLGFGKKRGPSTQTMAALLQRKQEVDSKLDTRTTETPLPDGRPLSTGRTRTQKHATPQEQKDRAAPVEPPPDDQQQQTTTQRLLDIKRRQQKDP